VKLAIVHDMLVARGGAERVLMYFAAAFPEAPVFTTSYHPDATYPEFADLKVTSTWYDRVAKTEGLYKALYFPFGMLAARSVDLTEYDVVLQSTTHGAKYAKVRKDALVISYCYTPFRLLWNPESYSGNRTAALATRALFRPILKALRGIDRASAQRPDAFIAMTEVTAKRISQAYGRDVSYVINPPVNCSNFRVSSTTGDYYLVVSRLEPYKKVDLAIRAFNRMGLPLRIVGGGTQEAALKSIANDNVSFLGRVNDNDLAVLYAECKALVFPQHEDYGLTPLEANASGSPVIAYAEGGILDTSVRCTSQTEACTAVLFEEQTEDSLIRAVERFQSMSFDPDFIRRHAERYDVPVFVNGIRKAVAELVERHRL
jgi:glycosyltransferase involved in cell wall biosynthesis